VDPFYLVYKAQELGYHPQVILAGRSVNDSMPKHVAEMTIKALNNAGKVIKGSKVLIMGLTFKENVDDTRETPVRHIIKELKDFHCELYGYDPLLSKEAVEGFGITPVDSYDSIGIDAVIITVVHEDFKKISLDHLRDQMNEHPVLIDVRGFFRSAKDHGFSYYTL
jgi:UDPglucose 6-dehydrogenase/UDP-N-acetyl-D-galactosamine dehydrogenase